MLPQAVEQWNAGAVHDTVGVLLEASGYRRSFWSSIGGRILSEIGRFLKWIVEAVGSIPGGGETLLILMLVAAVLIGLRLYFSGRWSDEATIRLAQGSSRLSRVDPWADAESLAASGRYLDAAHALYQAVLRRLAAGERIRIHSSRTSGEYARDLRRRGSPLAAPFETFGRRFDRVVFGAGVCTAADYDALLRDAVAIPDRKVAA